MFPIDALNADIKKCSILPSSLMSRLPYVTASTTSRSFYTDPFYYPAYYHLGKHLNSKNIVTFSLGTGLPIACFLLANKGTENVLAYQKNDDFYSPRMPKHNIRRVYKGNLNIHVGEFLDEEFQKKINEYKWDAVFIDNELPYDDYLMYLRAVWKVTEGYVFLDRVNSNSQAERAYHDFCRECNRDEMIIKSKYGIGVVEK